jgi:hypothetical protein
MTQPVKPVIIELADGATYGVASAAVARRVYPDAKIIGHQDGTPYEEEAPKPKRVRKSRAKQPAPPAVTPEGEGDGNAE